MGSSRKASTDRSRRRKPDSIKKAILRDVAVGFVLIVAFLIFHQWFKETRLGLAIESFGYAELQRNLIRSEPQQDPGILLIDISGIRTDPPEEGGATPRPKIYELLEALVKKGPRVIGVDIDFSADVNGPITPKDEDFFAKVLKLSEKVPIYLGVHRQRYSGPDGWLGEGFSSLAAAIAVPKYRDSRYYLRWMRRNGSDRKALPSMSLALADSIEEAGIEEHSWCVLTEKSQMRSEHEAKGRSGEMNWALINYSALGSLNLMKMTATGHEPIDQDTDKIQGHAVLLGDIHNFEGHDHFNLGLLHPRDVQGIFLHACGAITTHAPLKELTGLGVFVIDFLISVILVLAIAGFSFYAHRPHCDDPDWLFRQLLGCAIVLIIALAIVFIRGWGLVWTDFGMLVLALVAHFIFHHPASRLLERIIPWLRHHPATP